MIDKENEMFYGVEQTTDQRCPDTKIKKFTSLKQALKWRSNSGGYAWPGAARNDIPGPLRNFHHRLREVYEMPRGWRKPSSKQLNKEAWERSTSMYPRSSNEILASIFFRKGIEIK